MACLVSIAVSVVAYMSILTSASILVIRRRVAGRCGSLRDSAHEIPCLSQTALRVGKHLALERPKARWRVSEVAKAGEHIVETLGLP